MRIGYALLSSGNFASAIRINVVQTGCNRSVERSRYAESLSGERVQ
jgi:hypothetical protein